MCKLEEAFVQEQFFLMTRQKTSFYQAIKLIPGLLIGSLA
jgi:hypothetical protein